MQEPARVNLLVGDNNCGKTTVLEALHFLLRSDGRPSLADTAQRRGELVLAQPYGRDSRPKQHPTLQHFFHGHEIGPGNRFVVRSDKSARSIEIVKLAEIEQRKVVDPFTEFGARFLDESDRTLNDDFGIAPNGAFSATRIEGTERVAAERRKRRMNLIDEHGLSGIALRKMWDEVNAAREKARVIAALQIIDPETDDVYFDVAQAPTSNPRLGIRYARRGQNGFLPIGTLGHGSFRLLELGIALAFSRSGTLLIDEVGTGLHWSIMRDLWKLVIETAAHPDGPQVFATTHSYDCLRGLAWVCGTYPELGEHVSLQTIDPALDESVPLEGSRLPFVLRQQIEVR